MLKDPEAIARRAVTMAAKKGIESVGGRWIDMEVDTLCIHGDNAESVAAAGKDPGPYGEGRHSRGAPVPAACDPWRYSRTERTGFAWSSAERSRSRSTSRSERPIFL